MTPIRWTSRAPRPCSSGSTREDVLIEASEDEFGRTYHFKEDSVATYLWLLAAGAGLASGKVTPRWAWCTPDRKGASAPCADATDQAEAVRRRERLVFRKPTVAVSMSRPASRARFVQDNHAFSKAAQVLRGLHFQAPPKAQSKLIRCSRGSDLRRRGRYPRRVADLRAARGGRAQRRERMAALCPPRFRPRLSHSHRRQRGAVQSRRILRPGSGGWARLERPALWHSMAARRRHAHRRGARRAWPRLRPPKPVSYDGGPDDAARDPDARMTQTAPLRILVTGGRRFHRLGAGAPPDRETPA